MLKDIEAKIQQDFDENAAKKVYFFFDKIDMYVNQVIRSMLYLAEGDLNKIKYYYKMYCDDPRDVIGEAEEKAGNPGHWFFIPFDEMANWTGELPIDEFLDELEGDDFPF